MNAKMPGWAIRPSAAAVEIYCSVTIGLLYPHQFLPVVKGQIKV
jgi:hypothetical protein